MSDEAQDQTHGEATAAEHGAEATHGTEEVAGHGADALHGADAAGGAEGGLQIHPMDQFIVQPLFGDGPIAWYTPTNVTLWMLLAIVGVFILMVMGSRGRAIVPSRAQSVAELTYGFIRKMVEDVAGKDALPFFPYIMTLFLVTSTGHLARSTCRGRASARLASCSTH